MKICENLVLAVDPVLNCGFFLFGIIPDHSREEMCKNATKCAIVDGFSNLSYKGMAIWDWMEI